MLHFAERAKDSSNLSSTKKMHSFCDCLSNGEIVRAPDYAKNILANLLTEIRFFSFIPSDSRMKGFSEYYFEAFVLSVTWS